MAPPQTAEDRRLGWQDYIRDNTFTLLRKTLGQFEELALYRSKFGELKEHVAYHIRHSATIQARLEAGREIIQDVGIRLKRLRRDYQSILKTYHEAKKSTKPSDIQESKAQLERVEQEKQTLFDLVQEVFPEQIRALANDHDTHSEYWVASQEDHLEAERYLRQLAQVYNVDVSDKGFTADTLFRTFSAHAGHLELSIAEHGDEQEKLRAQLRRAEFYAGFNGRNVTRSQNARQTELQEYNKQLGRYKKALQSVENERDNLQKDKIREYNRFSAKVKELETAARQARKERKTAFEELEQQKAELGILEQSNRKLQSTELTELASYKRKYQTLVTEKTKWTKQLDSKQSEVDRAKSEVQAFNDRVDEAARSKVERAQSETEAIRTELDGVREQLDSRTDELNDIRQENERLTEQKASESESHKQEIQNIAQARNATAEKVTAQETKIARLEEEQTTSRETHRSELEAKDTRLANARVELQGLIVKILRQITYDEAADLTAAELWQLQGLEKLQSAFESAIARRTTAPDGWDPIEDKVCRLATDHHLCGTDRTVAFVNQAAFVPLLLESLSHSRDRNLFDLKWLDSTILNEVRYADDTLSDLAQVRLSCALVIICQNLSLSDDCTFFWSSCLMTEMCCRFNIPGLFFDEQIVLRDGDSLLMLAGKLRLKMLLRQMQTIELDDDDLEQSDAFAGEAEEDDAMDVDASASPTTRSPQKAGELEEEDAGADPDLDKLKEDDRFKPNVASRTDLMGLAAPDFLTNVISRNITHDTTAAEWFVKSAAGDLVMVVTSGQYHGWHRRGGAESPIWTFFDSKMTLLDWSSGSGKVGWALTDGSTHESSFGPGDALSAYVNVFCHAELQQKHEESFQSTYDAIMADLDAVEEDDKRLPAIS